jgi:hypothetical protein
MQTSAIAATIHGRDEPVAAAGVIIALLFKPAPTGWPQRWQKRAPGDNDALQLAQVVGSSEAPQLAQNRPVPGVAHAGQTVSGVGGCVMAYNIKPMHDGCWCRREVTIADVASYCAFLQSKTVLLFQTDGLSCQTSQN